MANEPDNYPANRMIRNDLDLDTDGERDVVEGELNEGLPPQLDASFEEPVPDAIDQRREVLLETDCYEA